MRIKFQSFNSSNFMKCEGSQIYAGVALRAPKPARPLPEKLSFPKSALDLSEFV